MIRPIGIKNVDGELMINNNSFYKLKELFQTPLYIIDERQLNKNIDCYLNNFKSAMFKTTICYATKAQLNFEIAKVMVHNNIMLDAVTIGDLFIIKEALGDLQSVVFHGNNKGIEEIKYALDNNVGLIVVDNILEFRLLDNLVTEFNKDVNFLIRVNPHIETHTHEYIQTSKVASKFGISIDQWEVFDEIKRTTQRNEHLKWLGIHAHIGSNIFETISFKQEISIMVNFINKLNNELHIALDVLNIGGGIGVKYNKLDPTIKLDDFIQEIICYLEDEICKTNSLVHSVMIEPGRSLIANAGVTLYSIGGIKNSDVKNYIFIDGGMTDNIRTALYQAKYSYDVVRKVNEEASFLADVVGKCCESGDKIIENGMFPSIDNNDLLLVYTTGAYNYSMASNYNGMLKPGCILVKEDGTVKEIVRREILTDLIKTFK